MTIHHTVGETEWVFYSNLVGRYSLSPNLEPQTPGVSHYSILVNSCLSSPSPVQAKHSGFLFGWGVNDLNAWSNHPRPPAQSHRCCQVLKIKEKSWHSKLYHSILSYKIVVDKDNSFASCLWPLTPFNCSVLNQEKILRSASTSLQLLSDIDCSIPLQWRLGVELKPV